MPLDEQPMPGPQIKVWAKPGRVTVTLDDGTYVGVVEYDVQNPAHLPLLAAAFANAVAQTANRVQPAVASVLSGLNGHRKS